MTEQPESEIKILVVEAAEDRDLSGFLEAMLDPSRSIAKVMTLRRADLLLSDEETGASLKWLVWADQDAMMSNLHRMKDYRRRASYEMNEFVSDFSEVMGAVFQTADPRLSISSWFESLSGSEDKDNLEANRIEMVKERIEELAKNKDWRTDFVESLMSYILSLVKSGMLMEFFVDLPISRLSSLLTSTGLDHSQYTDALNVLVNFELVSSQFTLFWCDECSSVPRTLVAPYIERPSKMQMKCPTCTLSMKVVSIIEPSFEVTDWLNTKDGLLAILVGYALESEELTWRANILDGREADFIVEKEQLDIIIETKVHKTYSDVEAIVSTLNNDLCQLAKTCDTLSKKKQRPIVGALIWNQNLSSEITEKVRLGEDVAKRYDPKKLIVVSLGGIASFVSDIAKPSFGIKG